MMEALKNDEKQTLQKVTGTKSKSSKSKIERY